MLGKIKYFKDSGTVIFKDKLTSLVLLNLVLIKMFLVVFAH